MFLEDELGFLRALVHRLEPQLNTDKILLSGVYDSKGILHVSDYRAKSVFTPPGSNDFAYHKDITSPIKDVADLSLDQLKPDVLCVDCFSNASDIAELIIDDDLQTGLFIMAKFDKINEGHDYARIVRENQEPGKIYSLALEYYNYVDETEEYLNNLWMNIPLKYSDIIEDYLEKQPYKLDIVHDMTLGSAQLKTCLRKHCESLFNQSFDNDELVLISLMPHYEIESSFSKVTFESLLDGESSVSEVGEKEQEIRDMHELTVSLLACYAFKSSYNTDAVRIPVWLVEVLKLTNPKVLLSKAYSTDDEVLIEIATKLFNDNKRNKELYSDFDQAMKAAERLK